MICKSCGGESRGTVCAHCGAPLLYESYAPATPPVLASVQTGKRAARPAKTARGNARAARKAAFALPQVKINVGAVLPAVFALLLPLCYLFFDAFVIYPDTVLTGEQSLLSLLVLRLTDGALAQNPVSDIIAATYGDLLSPMTYFSAPAAFFSGVLRLPSLMLLLPMCLCAVSALLLLVTLGRVLRSRILTDFIAFAAFLGTAAPFMAMLFSDMENRISHSAMRVHFTVEGFLLAAILLCLLPLAARRVYRVAGGDTAYVSFVARFTAVRLGRNVVRLLAALFALVAIFLPLYPVFFSLEEAPALLSRFVDGLPTAMADCRLLLTGLWDGQPCLSVALLADIGVLLTLPLLLLCSFFALLSFFRILFATRRRTVGKLRCRARLIRTGQTLRRPLWLALLALLAFRGIALLLIFSRAVQMHFAAASVEEALSVFYLLSLYVKTVLAPPVTGALLAALSFICALAAGNLSKAYVRLTESLKPAGDL